MRYIREEFRRQTRRPHGGLMAALIEAEEAGDRLTEAAEHISETEDLSRRIDVAGDGLTVAFENSAES